MIHLHSEKHDDELGFQAIEDSCLSSMNAEYVAITKSNKEMIYLQSFMVELGKE